MCAGHEAGGEGGGGGGRMGVAATALHEGMRVPIIRSKYLCCLMENLYTKVHDVCMHVCMHAS